MNEHATRDQVLAALERLHEIASSAELHRGYEPIYVDLPTVGFESPDWEILSGKPGAGKTMAMKAWEERVWGGVQTPTILPIYISGRDVLDAPNAPEGPHERAVAHFQLFLERFAFELQHAAGNIRRQQNVIERILGDRGARLRQKRIDQKLTEILEAVHTGHPLVSYDELIYEHELSRDREDRSTLSGRIQGGISEVGARIGVGAGASRESEQSTHSREKIVRKGAMAPRYAQIRSYVAELAEELEVERICVLIDNWSAIDPEVQPSFGELLARSLWGSPKVTVKIAINRSETQLLDSESGHGLQLGRDIHEGTDLDHPQMSETALVAFYEELLFKRLCYLDGSLESFLPGHTRKPGPEFLETIFESREAFEVLVKGTEGITRTFLTTVRRLARAGIPDDGCSVADVQELIGPAEVPLASAVQDTDSFPQLTEAELTLEYAIRPIVVATESRLLLVRVQDRSKARVPMSQLARREIIVAAFADDLPDGMEQFDAYWLSEEQWRTFARAISYKQDPTIADADTAEELEPRQPQISSEEDAKPYIVDFDRYRT